MYSNLVESPSSTLNLIMPSEPSPTTKSSPRLVAASGSPRLAAASGSPRLTASISPASSVPDIPRGVDQVDEMMLPVSRLAAQAQTDTAMGYVEQADAASQAMIFGNVADVDKATVDAMLAEAPADVRYDTIRLKGQGFQDEMYDANVELSDAIATLAMLLAGHPELELRSAETEADLMDALKLYRDMNHLSLAGGITCEHVVAHVQSHTVLLYYRGETQDAQIPVTAATFSMRQNSMMLRLLATNPRMTRKGFGRVTVHFLKELCRALYKTEIIVYTYPSSASFYKALHFNHTHPRDAVSVRPPVAPADADERAREAARDARRVFSAKENEMIFYVQPTMEQVLIQNYKRDRGAAAHPYACTRRHVASVSAGAGSSDDVTSALPPAKQDASGATHRRRQQLPPPEEPSSEPPLGSQRSSRGRRGCPEGRGVASTATAHTNGCGVSSSASEASASSSLSGTTKAGWCAAVSPLLSPRGPLLANDAKREDPSNPRKRSKTGKSEYQVEKIVAQKIVADEAQYLIKWKGWATKFNTWEPLSHLRNLTSEIAAFEMQRAQLS